MLDVINIATVKTIFDSCIANAHENLQVMLPKIQKSGTFEGIQGTQLQICMGSTLLIRILISPYCHTEEVEDLMLY